MSDDAVSHGLFSFGFEGEEEEGNNALKMFFRGSNSTIEEILKSPPFGCHRFE